MLFHAAQILTTRQGIAYRDVKPGEKPTLRPDANGALTEYADTQMRDQTHADIVLMALDTPLPTDAKLAEKEPEKWVKAVLKRETISAKITEALAGDGWCELKDEQADLILDRLAQLAQRISLGQIGPVMRALENPPEQKPVPKHANGHADRLQA